MGRVLLAHDPVLDRPVAIKHLRDDLNLPPEVRDGLTTRMRHEARAAARVMHPHLITLHDMGEDEALGLFLVFEYVDGITLKEKLQSGRLSPREAARLVRELGSALRTAHAAGILHRDIKPENIILSPAGSKIADFGIARIPNSTLTHAGGLMGTPAYSAPETFRESLFSPESDQFSLAATMYEAISGKRAFPGDDAITVAARIASGAPAPIATRLGLQPVVDEVLVRALSKEPTERFPSCEAFGKALAEALLSGRLAGRLDKAGPSSTPQPPTDAIEPGADSVSKPSDPMRERNPRHVVLGVIVVAITIGLLVRAALRSQEANTHEALDLDASAPSPASASASPSALSKPPPALPTRPFKNKLPSDSEADADVALEQDAGSESDASDVKSSETLDASFEDADSKDAAEVPAEAGAPSPQAPDAAAPPKASASSVPKTPGSPAPKAPASSGAKAPAPPPAPAP